MGSLPRIYGTGRTLQPHSSSAQQQRRRRRHHRYGKSSVPKAPTLSSRTSTKFYRTPRTPPSSARSVSSSSTSIASPARPTKRLEQLEALITARKPSSPAPAKLLRIAILNTANAHEYGFYSNVNPTVDHPRWSQASERRLGEFLRRKTLMFNGYGDQVAKLYTGMDLQEILLRTTGSHGHHAPREVAENSGFPVVPRNNWRF